MAANLRAEKSGFAKEVHQRLDAKFDQAEAAKTIRWIRALPAPASVPELIRKAVEKQSSDIDSISSDDFHSYFSSGLVLGHLMACLSSEESDKLTSKTWQVSDKAIFETSRQRERIGLFLQFAQRIGVPSAYLFQTDQLYERTNLSQVCICLCQLGVEMQSRNDYKGPENFWLKKQKENVRHFTEQQLKDAQNIPTMQMGYNGGASANGISFGGRRDIIS
ncbi:Transgelin [Cichlidogyrus casuarinus]|uniref:Transgelin n=1 Tax=Cichlidogyrus casuarinus TaxID=1844966 RepID=A0ABD2QKP0_9PLAT